FSGWYYGTDGAPPFGTYDFATVVLHELAHGLGFIGSMRVDDILSFYPCPPPPFPVEGDLGCWGPSPFGGGFPPYYPFVFDLYAKNHLGTPLLSFPNPSEALAIQMKSNLIYFDGPPVNDCFPVKLYTPSDWEVGSSFSHLDEEAYNGTAHALMTPIIFNAEANHDPGVITLGMFEDMGWDTDLASQAKAAGESNKTIHGGSAPTGSSLAYLPVISKGGLPCYSSQPPAPPIVNPGFESGPTGWTEYSDQGRQLIVNSGFPSGVTPHGGSWAAWLGGAGPETSQIRQNVSVSPATPYLGYWQWIDSDEAGSCGNSARVWVDGTLIDIYDLCASTDTSGWVKHVVNLGAYTGQTVELTIGAIIGPGNSSNLFVDDFSFQTMPPVLPTPTPFPAIPIANPGFEDGQTGWTQFPDGMIINSGFPPGVTPHSGSWAAWLGGDNNGTWWLIQETSVTVPAAAPYLAYWHWIDSEDVCGGFPHDYARVWVDGAFVDDYELCSGNNTSGWELHVVDLTAYSGQLVELSFNVATYSDLISNLFVDDVAFQSSPGAGSSPPATPLPPSGDPASGRQTINP
ncbi:MAG TPA: hypothetical protein VJ768_10590, partial [Anaerolineales bacterium]|nr:hypothetical protein [Anaerolineales bacterium]